MAAIGLLLAAGLAASGCGNNPGHVGARGGSRSTQRPAQPTPSSRVAKAPATSVITTTTTTGPGPPGKPGGPAPSPVIPQPQLSLAPSSGPKGTNVTVTATGCPAPLGGYVAFFADQRALSDPEQDPALRHVFIVSASGSGTASGSYQIPTSDPPGLGLFEIQCSGAGNAVAPFTVTGS
jgi:hypothetical protein